MRSVLVEKGVKVALLKSWPSISCALLLVMLVILSIVWPGFDGLFVSPKCL
tara:strand:- start:334 stop:486 length:153 start_codon:yes stop_codon:yes gene_type:complete